MHPANNPLQPRHAHMLPCRTGLHGTNTLRSSSFSAQDPCLSLAFDYADHDLYEIIRFHRERLRNASMSLYTVKSLMWQLLNGLSFMEQVTIMCIATTSLR